MSTLPPPLPSTQTNPGWFQRNWKWAIPTLVVTCLALAASFVILIFVFVTGAMRSSGAYQAAMERVQSHDLVVTTLGEPVEPGFLIMGNVRTSGPSGFAELSIPVSGPEDKATVYLRAEKSAGEWRFEYLVIEFSDATRLDLLEAP